MRQIALLRGINVGGHRKLKMEELKAMFRSMGFEEVTTYIQSGNIIFSTELGNTEKLGGLIKDKIQDTFGYEVPVIIRQSSRLQQVLDQYPFHETGGWKGYISFLAARPSDTLIEDLESLSSDIEKFSVGGKELYSLVDKKATEKPLFSNAFVEKKLQTEATTRNLRTIRKLLDLLP